MSYVLQNKNLEVQIDYPHENYCFSRFDWTGKITSIKFKNIELGTLENLNYQNHNHYGKGFYNEFGIESPLGFKETKIGDWFHKIGVGLLKKEDEHYEFTKPYKIRPAKFQTKTHSNTLVIQCISEPYDGYAYELRKEFELQETGLTIRYFLKNTGSKIIRTDEYAHNFTAIANDFIGKNYQLNFPFNLKPEKFEETVNPESLVLIGKNGITFNGSPKKQFFFSNLSGEQSVPASWEITHLKAKVGIRENTDFHTNKVNLWGWKHVISPELFFKINIAPGESTEWTRSYDFFNF